MLISANHNQWLQFSSLSSLVNVPPDATIILEANENNDHDKRAATFLVHRSVLAGHSTYFRALFANYNNFQVRLANIRGETFSMLLAYMYTGLITLTLTNVYEIFLASSSLQIVSLVNNCKHFLREDLHRKSRNNYVIKPVPRRRTFSDTNTSQHYGTMKYQPLRIDEKQPSIFKPVSHGIDGQSQSRSQNGPKEGLEPNVAGENNNNLHETQLKRESTISTNTIVYDIACCDGPIKFQKVINKFHKPNEATDCRAEIRSNEPAASQNFRQGYKAFVKNYKRIRKCFLNVDTTANDDQNKSVHQGAVQFLASSENHTCVDNNRNNPKGGIQYPCRSCGSKFPSYYFVNKHRKVCHINDEHFMNDNED